MSVPKTPGWPFESYSAQLIQPGDIVAYENSDGWNTYTVIAAQMNNALMHFTVSRFNDDVFVFHERFNTPMWKLVRDFIPTRAEAVWAAPAPPVRADK